MRVLLVEDAVDLATAVVGGLEQQGYVVDWCISGAEALDLAATQPYAALILDCMIPAPDGFEVCRRLRAAGHAVPILLLTARDAIDDRVAGLDAGADDYLVKPFAFSELGARLRALTRRQGAPRSNRLFAGGVTLDLRTQRVSYGEREVPLSAKERLLLTVLMRSPGQLFSHAQLLDHGWSADADPSFEAVRTHVKNTRRKLAAVGCMGLIQTVHGVGYRVVT